MDVDLNVVSQRPQTVEHSQQIDIRNRSEPINVSEIFENGIDTSNQSETESTENNKMAGIVGNGVKSENTANFEDSELYENASSSDNFEDLENSTDMSMIGDTGNAIIEGTDVQMSSPAEGISENISLKVENNHQVISSDNEDNADLQSSGVVENSPDIVCISELKDESVRVKDQSNVSNDQSKACSDDFNQSHDSIEKSHNSNDQNEAVKIDQSMTLISEEKTNQSDLKMVLSVSDCSAKVKSQGSSATSRSEVIESRSEFIEFIKKVDITYPKEEIVTGVKDDWTSNHGDETVANHMEDKALNIDRISCHINRYTEPENSRFETIRIGSEFQLQKPEAKGKVIRSKVKMPEVMTEQFDPSLYDLEKLKVTGLPLMKDNSTRPDRDDTPSKQISSKTKESDSDLSSSRKYVTSPEPLPVRNSLVNVVIENSFPSKVTTDPNTSGDNSVKKSISKLDKIENVRPVRRIQETIDENNILTIHTQSIMGDFVTPSEVT